MKEKLSKLFKRKSLFDYLMYAAIILGIILVDQLTKWLAVKYLMPIDTQPIIEGVIHLTYLENRGAAFGMLAGAPWVFNTFSVVAIVAILLYLYLGHADTRLYAIPLCMIAGGGIGNMIDRTMLGYVVDFIDFRLINFAVFNGADSFVCVGAGLLILALVLDIIKEAKGEQARAATTTSPTEEVTPETERGIKSDNATTITNTETDTATTTDIETDSIAATLTDNEANATASSDSSATDTITNTETGTTTASETVIDSRGGDEA